MMGKGKSLKEIEAEMELIEQRLDEEKTKLQNEIDFRQDEEVQLKKDLT